MNNAPNSAPNPFSIDGSSVGDIAPPQLANLPKPPDWMPSSPDVELAYLRGRVVGQAAASAFMAQESTNEIEEQHHNATHDKLTGLLNVAGLDERIERLGPVIERVGILYIDLKAFKAINTEYGHDGGDRALKGVASLLRSSDTTARIGGDEFLVLIAPDDERGEEEKTKETERRHAPRPMPERIVAARARIEAAMAVFLKANPGMAAQGLDLSIGATTGSAGDTIETMKVRADKEMALHKAEQYRLSGETRRT